MPETRYAGQEPYSQLEVVPAERNADRHLQAVPPGNEPYSALEVSAAHPDAKYFGASSITAAGADRKEYPVTLPETTPHRNHRRRWILWVLLIGVIVVGAVLGGTLGTILHHSKPQPSAVNG
jgi:hypothetical protein